MNCGSICRSCYFIFLILIMQPVVYNWSNNSSTVHIELFVTTRLWRWIHSIDKQYKQYR